MKKIFLALCALFVLGNVTAQTFTALTLSPERLQPGAQVKFTYDANMSPLRIPKESLEAQVYVGTASNAVLLEPTLTKDGNKYTGSFTLPQNARFLAFHFFKGENIDKNNGKGYIVYLRDDKGNVLPSSYTAAYNFISGSSEDYFKYAIDEAPYTAELKNWSYAHPEESTGSDFLATKLRLDMKLPQDSALYFINKRLSGDNVTEADYTLAKQYYSRNKNLPGVDSLDKLMKKNYPKGQWRLQGLYMGLRMAKDAAKRDSLIKELKPMYADNPGLEAAVNREQIRYYSANNAADFDRLTADMDKSLLISPYNSKAWQWAEKGEKLDSAALLAGKGLKYAEDARKNYLQSKPEHLSREMWRKQKDNDLGMIADTYSYILDQQGQQKEAYKYASVAVGAIGYEDLDVTERYAGLLARTEQPAIALPRLQKIISEGHGSAKIDSLAKVVYVKKNNSSKGFDAALGSWKNAGRLKMEKEVAKSMLNYKAPTFTLRDFDGKEVSIESLKGKVVVVDFWATWCGPCIASMPGMKLAMEKHPEVKFLFVDTWERMENDKKLANAKTFMEKKGYPFHVLMDDDNKVVESYGVSGIPTKFILDKNGNVRFKAVGYSGSDAKLVQELDAMISLAGK